MQVWRNDAVSGRSEALALDRSEDVFVAGLITSWTIANAFGVIKVSGATGALLWQNAIGIPDVYQEAFDVTTDTVGDVVAAGMTHDPVTLDDFTVVKFAGETGAERWRRKINGAVGANDQALAVVVNPTGDVYAAGILDDRRTCFDFAVARLSGASGDVQWLKTVDGTEKATTCRFDCDDGGCTPGAHEGTDQDRAVAVMLDAKGRVVAGGGLSNRRRGGPVHEDFTVVRWSPAGKK
jgi:hypothetical protein